MSIPNDTPMKRRPTHPGEILREDFMPDYELTVRELAEALGVSRQTVDELLRERRALSPDMALRLSALFGNSPEFWLDLQRAVDLWDAQVTVKDDVPARRSCARRQVQPRRIPAFDFLLEVNRRPEPFAEYTARELWTDSHTSGRMLAYHLDTTVDAASRNHAFLDRSVEWIVSHFELASGARVADFGCGPGLYAQRLAARGLDVMGIDFSANSLQYAREQASSAGLDIEYVEADYLGLETDRRFDLVMMIMCDFCALSPDQRAVLLRTFREVLADGGAVLLDVYSPQMFDAREESAIYARDLLDGFWSADEYFGFLNTFKYDEERLLLDKYTIMERNRIRHVFNWLQCFTPSEVETEFADCGLTVVERLGDVAGSAYDPDGTEFAVVARMIE